MKRPPLPLDVLLKGPALLYSGIMKLRNIAYDHGWLEQLDVEAHVLSIGNLTAGGTGKTPVTSFLVENLTARGLKVGIISRGYGGTSPGRERVASDGSTESAQRYGDEPSWLAWRHPDVPVFVGTDKVATARALLAAEQVDLIVADDAFQHRRLKRQMDLVILDATEPEWHYRSLPQGRLREGFASLTRAQGIFITKANLAEPERVAALKKNIESVSSALLSKTFEFEAVIEGFVALADDRATASSPNSSSGLQARPPTRQPMTPLPGERYLLASGIGRPHTFAELVRRATEREIVEHLVYRDHHAFSSKDLDAIEQRALEVGASAIVVTEKDAVKLTGWRPKVPCFVSRLTARPRTELEGFYASIIANASSDLAGKVL